jgi:O-antigen ligase
LAGGVAGLQVAAGAAAVSNPGVALTATSAALGAVLVVLAPSLVLLALLPASFGYWRVGPAEFNLSVADVVLVAAFLSAVPFVPWQSRQLRSFLRVLSIYLGVLAIAVAVNPSRSTVFEWGHRAMLVGAALAVGVAIATKGLVTPALRLYVVLTIVLSTVAFVDSAGRPFEDGLPSPAYPFGLQKNPAALLIAMGLLAIVVASHLVRLPRAVRPFVLATQLVGIAACQSRGTAIAMVLVLGFWMVRTGRVVRSPLVLVAMVCLAAVAYVSFNALFQSDQADSRFNSVNSRLDTYESALDAFEDHPIAGVGLKFWRDPAVVDQYGGGEPHNLVIAALGESGVVGIVALAILLVGAVRLLASRRDELGLLALTLLVVKATASLFDIFWVAGTMTVPWVVIGMACVAGRAHDGRHVVGDRAERTSPELVDA